MRTVTWSLLVVICLGGVPAAVAASAVRFTSAAASTGIDFVSTDGQSGRFLFAEFVGQGVGLFDYDSDDDLDVYLVNGRSLVEPFDRAAGNTLYRNDGAGTFTDVTADAGVADTGYGYGCTVGDVDGDGLPDLLVTNFGSVALYRNRGGGSFENITRRAGIDIGGMCTGSAFSDIDLDGDLDLYIARYAEYSVEEDKRCVVNGFPIYCNPYEYPPSPDVLLLNQGDGVFVDGSAWSGIDRVTPAHGFGVVFSDLDLDGDADLYVANDVGLNFLFVNDGGGRFTELGLLAGTATNAVGRGMNSMGAAVGDYDGDGLPDIVVTNYQDEPFSLYRNDGHGLFTETSSSSGVGGASHDAVGWGVGFVDFDNDGFRDLFCANGHSLDNASAAQEDASAAQPALVMRNVGDGSFEDVTESSGAAAEAHPSRGAAFGDIDGDGDVDAIATTWNGRPEVLLNDHDGRGAWCLVRAISTRSAPAGVGAKVSITAGGRTQVAEIGGGGSYLSHSDLRVHFGLGSAARIDAIEVRWPGGIVDRHTDLPTRRLVEVTEGGGVTTRDLAAWSTP